MKVSVIFKLNLNEQKLNVKVWQISSFKRRKESGNQVYFSHVVSFWTVCIDLDLLSCFLFGASSITGIYIQHDVTPDVKKTWHRSDRGLNTVVTRCTISHQVITHTHTNTKQIQQKHTPHDRTSVKDSTVHHTHTHWAHVWNTLLQSCQIVKQLHGTMRVPPPPPMLLIC